MLENAKLVFTKIPREELSSCVHKLDLHQELLFFIAMFEIFLRPQKLSLMRKVSL